MPQNICKILYLLNNFNALVWNHLFLGISFVDGKKLSMPNELALCLVQKIEDII